MIEHSENDAPVEVEIWTDVVCPWCYIGKRRFEKGVHLSGRPVKVTYRSFELDPDRQRDRDLSLPEMLAAKYRVSLDEAKAMNQRVTDLAAAEGLEYRLDLARPSNTFDAHRLIHQAAADDRQEPMVERLKAAYFIEGRKIDDRETLVDLAAEVGISAEAAAEVLGGDRFSEEVRTDEALAEQLGIRGVPFFALDRRYGISGAQEPGSIAQAITQAWIDKHPDP